jgi:single-strand DNA-binding protein
MNDLLTQLIECNQWRFIGRLGADPEIRYFESGASVCNARLLVNKPGQKRDDGQKPHSFKLELWREKAQSFADAAKKGDLIDVQGMVKVETWTDRTTAEERSGVVLNVERYEVLARPLPTTTQASPATSAWAGAAPAAPAARPAAPAASAWGTSAADLDSEVPF